jgi:hypothetical protein
MLCTSLNNNNNNNNNKMQNSSAVPSSFNSKNTTALTSPKLGLMVVCCSLVSKPHHVDETEPSEEGRGGTKG